MADEYSDILGAGTLPIGPKKANSWSSLSLATKSALILALLLTSYAAFNRLWGAFWKWREREYKLSMRRKYGIPDNDHRPFNVAYAAAQLAREQEDKQRVKRRSAVQPSVQGSSSREQRDACSGSIRHRPVDSNHAKLPGSISEDRSYLSTGGNSPHSNACDDHHHSYNRVTFADGYNTSASPLDLHAELASTSPSRRVNDRKNIGILKSSNHNYVRVDQRKRALGGDDLDEQVDLKKTRVEGEELIDGDEEPEWQNNAYGRVPSLYSKGSKREPDQGDVRERGKRQRKISAEKMEVDEDADVVGDLVSVSPSRGKKRDRAEAGSTFGGDEEEGNVALDEDHDNRSRLRKRRNKRTSDVHSGSRKRDRDMYDTGDFSDSNEDFVGSRGSKKKGKKHQQRSEDEKGSDVSMDESQLVRSTIKGRKIGEEWTSNGIKYKIGPIGQRLRETLLKKAKQRFVMPEDSMHPDRNAFHDVYVEAWLTDEEYQNSAAQGIIYEPPKEPETSSSSSSPRSTPPVSKGKHLLWESTIIHSPTLPLPNPFETARKAPEGPSNALISRSLGPQMVFLKNGRIASAFRGSVNADSTSGPPSPSLADSTNSFSSPRAGRYRQYSKWEKQDLEAQAMMRMREANNKKKEEEDKLAREKEEQEARAKVAITPASTVPTISFTKPPEDQAKEEASKTSSPFSLGGSTSAASPSTPASGTTPKLSGIPASAGTNNMSIADNKPKASSPLSFSLALSSSNTTSSSASAVPAAPSGFSFAQPSAPSGRSQETISTIAKPAPHTGFSFAQPPSSPHKSQDGPMSIGLGFPSATQPQIQPATNAFVPPAPASTTTTPAATSTTAPKFNFGLPAKPVAPLGVGPNKVTTPNTGGGSVNPLLARLSPTSASSGSNVVPSQGLQSATTPSVSMPSNFSFTKPAPLSAPSSSSNVPMTQGQKPPESQTQQVTPPASSGPAAPLKFSFGGFKGPTTNTTPASTLSATSAPGSDSTATSAESKASTQNVSAFSKPQESSNTSPATSSSKFSFGAPASSSGGGATTSTGGTFSFGGFGGTSSTVMAKGSPSPFGSVFGAFTPATPSVGTTAATETKEQLKMIGTGMTGSAFGNSSAPSAFGSGSLSNTFGSKADSTFTTNNVTPSSAFGNTGNTVNGFGAFGSKAPDSTDAATGSKSAFGGFGSSSAPAPTTMSQPFGIGSSSTPGSSAFGSSTKNGEASTFSIGASTTAEKPDAATKPTSSFSFGGSTTPAGTPATVAKSPFSFGAPPSTSAFSFGNSTSSTTPAPFGENSGTAPTSGVFGGNTSTTNLPGIFFGSTQQPK